MGTAKNVMIPLSLMEQTIDLLESIEGHSLDYPISCLHELVLSAFYEKSRKMDLRESYAGIIFAGDDEQRHDARMKYLFDKRDIKHRQ